MANTEIDSLSLDIRITGLKKEDVANIDKLSKAVSRLTKSLKEADFSKLKEIQVPKGLKNIQIITQNLKSNGNDLGAVTNEEQNNNLEKATELLESYSHGYDDVSTSVEDASLIIESASEKIKVSGGQARKSLKELLDEVNNTTGKSKKELKKIEKVFRRFRTVAFIKAIRAILNAIVQAVKKGVTSLAQFDKEFNKVFSQTKSSIEKLVGSLGLIIQPIIEASLPFIEEINNVIINIGNNISRINAQLKGQTTYTKINAKYMEDYAKSLQKSSLFSFDTFNTLDTQDNSLYETANVDEQKESNDLLKTAGDLINNIKTILGGALKIVGTIIKEVVKLLGYLMPTLNEILNIVNNILEPIYPFLEDLFSAVNELVDVILNGILAPLLSILNTVLKPIYSLLGVILPIISNIVGLVVDVLSPILESFKPALDAVNEILSPIMEVISFIVELVGGLIGSVIDFIKIGLRPIIEIIENVVELIGNLSSMIKDLFTLNFKDFFRKLGLSLLKFLASMVDSVVNLIIDGLNLIWAPLNALSDWFGWGWKIGIPHINLASLVPSFANGGIVGEIWQMNEYGNPEMLYNSNNNSNNTAVINQAQLSLAFEQAIYNTGILDAIAKAGIINIDGRAIAQSNSFKNEINRTNPGLNIR